MAKFKAVLRNSPNAAGERVINIRVSTTDGTSYKSIGSTYRCSEDNWDEKNGYILRHPDKTYMSYVNSRIDKIKSELRNKYLSLNMEEDKVLPSEVTASEKRPGHDFIQYFEKYNTTISNIGTKQRFDNVLKKLMAYSSRLPVSKINAEWLRDYEVNLRKLGNEGSTIRANMSAIQKVYNVMPQTERLPNPWVRYKKPAERVRKDYLDEAQLKQMSDLNYFDPESKRYILQNLFIFACDNCGPRISDILLLEWPNKREDRIVFDIKKTPKVHSIPLFKRGEEIIGRFKGASRWIFPVLDESLDLSDKVAVNKAIGNATSVYNAFLKDLATKAQVTGLKFSSHLARHTFATMALKKGMNLEYIASLMGISIRQAERYAKIIKLEVEQKAREKLDK